MDRLHELEVFVAASETGSLAGAAARLRISRPAATRAIAALEDRLGVPVFTRTTRRLTITEAGRRFLSHAQRILAEFDAARKEAAGEGAAPAGHLTVTASVTFGRAILAPIVCDFLGAFPRVTASVLLLDRVTNLVEEGIDLAVRIGPLPDSSLIARRVGDVRRMLVASPDYLARQGMPAGPGDLKRHSVIAFTGLMLNREWRHLQDGRMTSLALSPRFEINDALAAIDAAMAGHGLTIALSYMVEDLIRQGALVPVLEHAAPLQPVHIVYPQSRMIAPKVRAFIDFATPRLEAALRRHPA